MKNTILRFAVLCLGFALILGGCSRNNNNSATPSPSPSASPESSVMPTETPETIASVQDLLDYFQTNNYTFNQVTPIENTDFNALEGTSFQYNDQVYYLYRFDPANEESRKMLNYASQNGRMKVNANGQETEYYAYVNGNTALIYDSKEMIEDLKEIYSQYRVPSSTQGQ